MRVSEAYDLGRTQPELDFVDVDTHRDAALFIDPRALLRYRSEWGNECVSLIQEFFAAVLAAIAELRDPMALLGQLHEPNETRLGFSSGRAQGRALGPDLAQRLGEALTRSRAVRTGLLRDLEDAILLIPGIGPDLVSDIATNVIRGQLVRYTQEIAGEYGMPLVDSWPGGPIWSPESKRWESELRPVLRAERRPLLLVPKAIVRRHMDYDDEEYFEQYIIPFLQGEELDAASGLVQLLKNGNRRVTKKAIREKYGTGKEVSEQVTLRRPELLEQYRADKEDVSGALPHESIAEAESSAPPDWDALLETVVSLVPGVENADAYHVAVKDLLTALFYPALTRPVKEAEIHEGRKRIDLSFTNIAKEGFFHWLGMHYPAPNVFVECKNYSRDIANAELDQLAGRFSPSRGRFGLLVTRSFEDKGRFVARCRDTADDQRGFIVALDDDDLRLLVGARKQGDITAELGYLKTRFDQLVM
jgi:hypothetical protein